MAIKQPNFYEAANKAAARIAASGTDIEQLARDTRMGSPDKVASELRKQQRRKMLENLYSEKRDAQQAFERIIGGNELQDANYLPRGTLVARAVVRVVIKNERGRQLGFGSGFFVGDGVLMTNNHVLKNEELAKASEIEMFYERDVLGQDRTPLRFRLNPDRLFYTNGPLDFTIVAVEEHDVGGKATLEDVGWLPLIAELGKVMEGEWLTIVQHPNGERKQVCARDNQFLARDNNVLWYSTDTLGGSSGSPVFTNDWLVVALHHSGVPRIVDGVWKTVNGEDYDKNIHSDVDIDWIANEGIRISKIIELLRTDLKIATHPMIAPMLNVGVRDITARLPVMFRGGRLPDSLAEIVRSVSVADYMKPGKGASDQPKTTAPINSTTNPATIAVGQDDQMLRLDVPTDQNGDDAMTTQNINLTLSIKDGVVSVANGVASGGQENASMERSAYRSGAKEKRSVLRAPVNPARDWAGASGYNSGFLGGGAKTVNLPEFIPEFAAHIAPLQDAYGETFTEAQKEAGVLNYINYSVVMNATRKFAFYSAANIDWGMRPYLSGRDDRWMYDDRISRNHQVDNSYYKHNKFDRGHLTRREDLEFGADPIAATISANNTCTWTNCVPQHSRFNQNKQMWQGLERYILENSSLDSKFKVQAFTGPVFGSSDPEYRGLAYPLEFWKVLAAINPDGKLFATAYLLSQEEAIDQHGLEITDDRFGAYKTFQVPVSEIEGLTGLRFTSGTGKSKKRLSEADPLARTGEPHRVTLRRGSSGDESFSNQSSDGEIFDFSDIILD